MTGDSGPDDPQVVQLDLVRQALNNAEPQKVANNEPQAAADGSLAPAPGAATVGGPPLSAWGDGDGREAEQGLPPGCPVTPLGKGPGVCYYLDANRQLMELKAKDHSKLGLTDLFGPKSFLLREFWPRYSKPDKDGNFSVVGWKADDVAEVLMASAARSGVWNPLEKVRGGGAWKDKKGDLVLHCGDVIFRGAMTFEPGLLDGYVYPSAEAIARPTLESASSGQHCAAGWLLELMATWRWRRPGVDPMLLLGWVGAAMIGGALDWRPAAWITGGSGTGKSTLQDVLKSLFGAGGLVSVSDPTAAGIWQKLGHASLPVALDEIEAEADSRKVDNIVKLARQAASGGMVLRGGADHKGVEFTARSCFLFSSILIPPMETQDLSRLAVLDLEPLSKGAVLQLDHDKLGKVGEQLRRRMLDGWPRLTETIEIYGAALAGQGHTARGAAQFGALLACADLLLHDHETDGEYAANYAKQLAAGSIAAWADAVSDELGMLQFLATSLVDPFRGGARKTLGEWIREAAGIGVSDAELPSAEEAGRILGTYGLKVEFEEGIEYLAITNQHQGLAKLFEDTKWRSKPGRPGGWVQTARRIEGHLVPAQARYIGGATTRCTLVPLAAILPGQVTPIKPVAALSRENSEEDHDLPF